MREWVVLAEMVQEAIAEDLARWEPRYRRRPPRFREARRVLARFLFRAGRWVAPPVPGGEYPGLMEDSWRISRT